ncbi:MAG: DUF3577 domain-containing protein [Gammaproteobacteria bacterium]|nr:DUF3577 domain-containing protein [Gammaproteobacteria bacterium]
MSYGKYFNLHTTGLGYANRFHKVAPLCGQPFYAVNISALAACL